jgi:hypothetical protein
MPRPKTNKRPFSPAPQRKRKSVTKADLFFSPAPPSRRSATIADLAKEQQVSIRTISKWMAEGKIPFKKLSPRMVRFDLDDVARALDRYTVQEVTLTTSRKSKRVN